MKLAFSTNAYRNFSIEQSIESIALIGYDGVEIMCDVPHAYPPLSKNKISSIRNSLLQQKIKISNLNAFMLCAIEDFHHPSWIEKNPKQRQQRINHTINCIKLAKELGAETVSTEPGGPNVNLDKDEQLELFSDGLREVIPYAEDCQVKLLIEPEPDLLIENSNQFLSFISKFDSKYLGLNFDIGHFFCVNEEPSKLIIKLQKHIQHIHLEDISKSRIHKHLIPGHGAIDFISIFDSLKEINYDGYVTVELYPYEKNPESAAKDAYDFLTSLNLS